MAPIKQIAPHPWRKRLVVAQYAGARFHVEQQARQSGRRVALHEYPKRDKPYGEDMGRAAIRYQITGYVISELANNYDYQRDKHALIARLEGDEGGMLQIPGVLIDSYQPNNDHLNYGNASGQLLFVCEGYAVTESRERGGYAVFEMRFVEAGAAANSLVAVNTKDLIMAAADAAAEAAKQELDKALKPAQGTIAI